MSKLALIDGNSIANRAFYGIMGSKMLMTKDGKYTNAVYGFLAILFKLLDEVKPDYIAVAFDLKAPTARHKLYEGYKANRKGMPEELRMQMPMIKEILRAMNIDIIEKEGYEADDVLGTLSRYGEKQVLDVVILSGDRDTFQLATDKVTIILPRTKAGKTEVQEYDRKKIEEEYGIEPKQLIEVKGLQGDTSDNIPGVPGIGEKTALNLIKEYGSIENLYNKIEKNEDNLKGKQREKILENKDLAEMSKFLGTINLEVPIENTLEEFKVEPWDNKKVLEIFKNLNFKRYIERFKLDTEDTENTKSTHEKLEGKEKTKVTDFVNIIELKLANIEEILKEIKQDKELIFFIESEKDENPEKIIKEKIISISIYEKKSNKAYVYELETEKDILKFKEVLEDEEIKKVSIHLSQICILLRQIGIKLQGLEFDAKIAGYILNPTDNKLKIEDLSENILELDINKYIKQKQEKQINLFEDINEENQKEEAKNSKREKNGFFAYIISNLKDKMTEKLKEINAYELFKNIDMPTVLVLADMQFNGMYVNKESLEEFGLELSKNLEEKTKIIYEMAGTQFNINSTKQLGEVLFEKMKLPVIKKTKSGYSTDVDVLEKLKKEDPIIQNLLDYRQLMKLNSTYIEGLKPYINPKTKRIHSFFHQTITATGRISSTEPNLQNIPTRFELGKRVRKVFEPEEGKVYIDADYSQIELRVLAHMSGDTHMQEAFRNNEDIHKQAASKVFKTPIDEVTKEQRSNAKAVNFGIVYGISDFGLSEQLGISRKLAKTYIDEYLAEYPGIKQYMENIIELAKKQGYVETLFNRRRYIPEISSKNYMVRQFGNRAAMNTPIQGTAADIMKIAMIKVKNELMKKHLEAKIVLQVHDEMMIEAKENEIDEVKEILKTNMEQAVTLDVPLIAKISVAKNWYDCK